MNYTTNYQLNKPERNEQFNIDHWNANSDKIDSAMRTNATNISTNATNISTLFTGLNTRNTSDTSSVYFQLMKLIYPVGSIYWSSNSTNPSTLFGGTWAQIKDRFVVAKGDTNFTTVGATGGNLTVSLQTTNLPSHDHSFKPSGTVENHRHSFTPSGTVSSSFSGSTATGSIGSFHSSIAQEYCSGVFSYTDNSFGNYGCEPNAHYNATSKRKFNFSMTPSGTVSSSFSGSAGYTGYTQPSFTGTDGTTGKTGSGTAFNILPPYVVKYCWERTA